MQPSTTVTSVGYDRLPALMSLMTGDEKHGPSATSTLDVLWVLYDRFLSIDPARPEDPDRGNVLSSNLRRTSSSSEAGTVAGPCAPWTWRR